MSLEQIVGTYGYLALLIGTFFEGETILVIGGFLAFRGYLELPWVVAAAFVGSFAGDQLFYYLGRTQGIAILEKRPVWKAKSKRALALLRTHQVPLMLSFRFFYGLRTVTPFLIGASRVPVARFVLLNALGGLLWAVAIASTGFWVGHSLESALGKIKRYELAILGLMAFAGLLLWCIHRWRLARKEAGH